MARHLMNGQSIPRLSLDEIAWGDGAQRKSLDESISELHQFLRNNDEWIIEGCYGDLIEAALPFCTELRFLNPGVEVCVNHCLQRPWEPEKFSSESDQREMLATLIQWVREYERRPDEYGLTRHREIFDSFSGIKKEYRSIEMYEEG